MRSKSRFTALVLLKSLESHLAHTWTSLKAPDSHPGLHIRRLRSSTRRLERVLDHEGRELSADILAGADRGSVVHAAPHADILLLLGHIGQAGELPRPLRISHIGCRERNSLHGTEHRFQNC